MSGARGGGFRAAFVGLPLRGPPAADTRVSTCLQALGVLWVCGASDFLPPLWEALSRAAAAPPRGFLSEDRGILTDAVRTLSGGVDLPAKDWLGGTFLRNPGKVRSSASFLWTLGGPV